MYRHCALFHVVDLDYKGHLRLLVRSHGIQKVGPPHVFALIRRAICLESKNHPEDPLWGNQFHQHIPVYAVASLIALALWHPKTNKDSRNPNLKLFYARWLWGWEQRDKALRGRGRAGVSSVGRDPETLLSVKILPNQQGLHPKCSPTNQQSFVSCNLYIGWLVLCQNYLQKVSCKLNLQQQP